MDTRAEAVSLAKTGRTAKGEKAQRAQKEIGQSHQPKLPDRNSRKRWRSGGVAM